MMLLGLCFMLVGCVMVACGVLRESFTKLEDDLPEIEVLSELT